MKVQRIILAALAATSIVATSACDDRIVQIGVLKFVNVPH